jgi:CRP-like cAMP-binding protein
VYKNIPGSKTLFHQDVTAQSVILIESGWIKLVRLEEVGQEQIIALYPSGSLLGVEPLISNQQHYARAITLVNCKIYSIPAQVFLNWVKTDTRFSWQLPRALSRRIIARDISSAQSRGVASRLRLEQLLWQLLYIQNLSSENGNNEWWFRESKLFVPLQRQELARMISITPEHLSRLFKKMEKDGVIRRDKEWVILPCPEGLWRAPEIQTLANSNLIQSSVPDLPYVIFT